MKKIYKDYIRAQATVLYLKQCIVIAEHKAAQARREFLKDYPKGDDEDKFYDELAKEKVKAIEKAEKDYNN